MKTLLRNMTRTSYDTNTTSQLDYYIDERKCNVGNKAYVYSHKEGQLIELEIIHIRSFLSDTELYDFLLDDPDILLNGEERYHADASAEFISDNNCYLVWFKYTE